MKSRIQNLFIALGLCAGIYQANSAVTFTISPSAISNTYSGIITLNVSGLTAGDTVVVQKFLEADSNSVLDSSAILFQQFQITDGQAAVFKNGAISVTNFNVPGDTDGSANGSITANLFANMDFAQTIVGEYYFKLSSPSGHFSPITNSFVVTNFPFAQSISGSVVNNGTNVPDAVIILFQPSNGGQNPQGGVVANNSGGYRIAVPAGTYELAGVRTNYVASLASSPAVSLSAGAAIVTNVPLMNATLGISGQVVDANNSSIGISGYLLPLQTGDNLLAVGFTDTNGNFSVGVTADQWKIQKNQSALLVKGYLVPGDNSTVVDTTTGSVLGVTLALPKETAIFYGTIKGTTGTPLTGAEISAQDNETGNKADGVAFTNGNYVASAIGGTGDQWWVQYEQDGPANYLYSQAYFAQNGGTNINVGQAIPVNFMGLLATNTISGNVQDSDGNPVTGLGVNASATINNVSYSAHADTDNNGNYSLNAGNGDWDVSVNCGDGGDGLDDIFGAGNFECPNDDYVTIGNDSTNANFTVEIAGSGCTLVVTTTNLPIGLASAYYDQFLEASSCYPPFTWSLNGGSLPPGIQLDPDGEIYGTTASTGTFNFSVSVTDDNDNFATQAMALQINSPPVTGGAISNLKVSNGNFQFSIPGTSDEEFTIEFSTNLVNWTILLNTNSSGGSIPMAFPLGTNTVGFYRAFDSGLAFGGSSISPSSLVYSVSVTNESATVTLIRTGVLTNDLFINYGTSDGTALAGTEYVPVAGTIHFSPGQTSAQVSIPLLSGNQFPGTTTSLSVDFFSLDGTSLVNVAVTITDGYLVGIWYGGVVVTNNTVPKVVTSGSWTLQVTGIDPIASTATVIFDMDVTLYGAFSDCTSATYEDIPYNYSQNGTVPIYVEGPASVQMDFENDADPSIEPEFGAVFNFNTLSLTVQSTYPTFTSEFFNTNCPGESWSSYGSVYGMYGPQ